MRRAQRAPAGASHSVVPIPARNMVALWNTNSSLRISEFQIVDRQERYDHLRHLEYSGGAVATDWMKRPLWNPVGLYARLATEYGFAGDDIHRVVLNEFQKVSGQSYEEYVDEHLFAPLGMEHSTFLLDAVDPALLASPHVLTEYGLAQANIVVSDLVPFSREFAASDNLYSNAEDMSRMMAALLNGGELEGARILTPESVKLLSARSGAALDPIQQYTWGYEHPAHLYVGYGMGSFIDEIEGCSVYHLFGLQLGYRANIMLCPDQKLGVVLMGNRGQNERLTPGGDEFYANEMLPDLMSMLLGAE